ncbi:MAG TPA: DUF2680 domain-containing protein [Clostridiaceae bacterium]|nr:DUF2680 domain-containing protein [Clostridiaceae bacterium]
MKRKIAIFIGTLLLVFTLITTAFATPVLERVTEKEQFAKPELTDEMKQKIEKFNAERQERIKKWEALTEAQKAEIYKLQDQIAELSKKMIDKYCEYKIIDKNTADQIKEKIDKMNSEIKSEGKMPMLDRGKCYKKGKKTNKQSE